METAAWLCLFSLFLHGLQQLPSYAIQGSVAKDPYDICSDAVLELRDLTLVELREYERSKERWHAGTPELVQRIFKHQLLLPESLLQRGISNLGDLSSTDRALQKLANGKPITVVALGGSVSAGHGVLNPDNGWIPRVFTWIEDTFPDADHTLLNRAIPAVTSGYVSACVPELVPEGTDLVLLEFTYNDHVFGGGDRNINDASRRGLERLLRRLLSHSSRPGILYVHYWPAARFQPMFFNDEDLVDNVLKYYGIPTLSMRNALHGLLAQHPKMLDQLWWPQPDPKIHPTCIGARMMADLVIGHLQHLTAGFQEQPVAWQDTRLEVAAEKQPFLLAGNWGHTHTVCVLENDFPRYATDKQGWSWVDEGKTKKQHKWGFVSRTPGSRLEIEVPLALVPAVAAGTQRYLVGIGGLISHQHMGRMQLQCSGGCKCPRLHHDMYHSQKFSMTGWRYVNLTKTSERPCLVVATNSPESSTGEHKLKISSLMISVQGEVVEGTKQSMLNLALTNLNKSWLVEQDSFKKRR